MLNLYIWELGQVHKGYCIAYEYSITFLNYNDFFRRFLFQKILKLPLDVLLR